MARLKEIQQDAEQNNSKSFARAILNARIIVVQKHECPSCDEIFQSRHDLIDHLKSYHNGDIPFKCIECTASFATSKDLLDHISHHSDKRHECKFCGLTFMNLYSLAKHSKRHEGPNTESCSICNIPYRETKDLMKHMRTHADGKPHKCLYCEKHFAQSCDRQKHMRIHTGEKPYVCGICGKSFAHLTSIKKHNFVHTGERAFQCTICGKSFQHSSNLVVHNRTHSGERPYKCKVCEKTFYASGNYVDHMKIHTGIKNYECQVCKKSFIHLSSFQKHKRVHSGEKIVQSDELPNYICSDCFIELENVHQFRQKCLMSDLQLRSEILKLKSLAFKLEPLELIDIKDEVVPNDEISFCDEHIDDCDSKDFPLNSHDDFTCDICNANFKRKSGLSSHMANHVRTNMCNLTSINLQPQRVHRNLFSCNFGNCNKSYSTSRGLRRHASNVHPKTVDRILKPQNKSVFHRKRLFCPKCPKWFGVQEKLDDHIRRFHEGLKGYKCENEMCGKEFNKLRSFRLHVDTFHSSKEIPMFKCDFDGCNKEYNLRESLRRHIEVVHFKKVVIKTHQNLICETCGKLCRNAHSLKVHGYSHNGDFPFKCSRCPRKFESSYKLKIHILKHLNIKNFVCPHCGLRKMTNRELQHHLNVHSDEKKFQCKDCPQAFNTYGSLNNHVRIHHKKYKPYTCSHCNQKFAKKGTMKNHEMTHTGEKPYVCHCGHRFIQAVSLRLHLKVHANQSKSTRNKGAKTDVEHQETK